MKVEKVLSWATLKNLFCVWQFFFSNAILLFQRAVIVLLPPLHGYRSLSFHKFTYLPPEWERERKKWTSEREPNVYGHVMENEVKRHKKAYMKTRRKKLSTGIAVYLFSGVLSRSLASTFREWKEKCEGFTNSAFNSV